jgi:hypothetical protein
MPNFSFHHISHTHRKDVDHAQSGSLIMWCSLVVPTTGAGKVNSNRFGKRGSTKNCINTMKAELTLNKMKKGH